MTSSFANNIGLLSNYILAILLCILLALLVILLVKLVILLVKKLFWSGKQILSPTYDLHQISIVNVLEAILRVLCDVDTTDYNIKTLISDASNIIISAKFGYCSSKSNRKYDKKRSIYENKWLEDWTKYPSNITKTYSVFLQVRHKFHLLSEIEQINDTDKDLIHNALTKIDMWLMSQSDHDTTILIT
jgi:hypothetical protein